MDWNHIKIFAAVASEGSLSGAARLLKLSQPTVGRHIESLEAQLNVRLFDREARGLELTCAGERLLPMVANMERAALSINDAATGAAGRIEGTVRITSPEMTSRVIGRHLAELRGDLPNIQIEFLTTDRVLNMSRREADIAIRPKLPEQGDLRAKLAYVAKVAIYASEDYAAANPQAYTEDRFTQCDWVTQMQRHKLDRFDRYLFEKKHVKHAPINCTSGHTMIEAILGGAGLSLLLSKHACQVPGLVRVSDHIDELDQNFWLVAHAEVLAQPRVRAVWDWLAAMLSREYGNL